MSDDREAAMRYVLRSYADLRPAEVFHPGDYLADELEARGWTAHDVALRMEGDPCLNECAVELTLYVRHNSPWMDVELARNLERALGISAECWLRHEAAWQLFHVPTCPECNAGRRARGETA